MMRLVPRMSETLSITYEPNTLLPKFMEWDSPLAPTCWQSTWARKESLVLLFQPVFCQIHGILKSLLVSFERCGPESIVIIYDYGLQLKYKQRHIEHRKHFDPFINMTEVKDNANSFEQFVRLFICWFYGYKNPQEYYSHASSVHYVDKIRIPAFFLNALDDPICVE